MKNIWSLQTGEAIVADKVAWVLGKKNYPVFFPLNSQLKDVDLLVVNLKTRKTVTLQVKESRQFGDGIFWYQLNKRALNSPEIDFFALLGYSMVDKKKDGVTRFQHDVTIIPAKVLKKFQMRKLGARNVTFYLKLDGKKATFFLTKPKRGDYTNARDCTAYLDNFKQLRGAISGRL